MSDIQLTIQLSPDQIKKIEERIKQIGKSAPIEIPVKGDGPKGVGDQAKYAAGTVGDLKQQMAKLRAEIDHLGDVDAIKAKKAEVEALEAKMDELLGTTQKVNAAQSKPSMASGGGAGLLGGVTNIPMDKLALGIAAAGLAVDTAKDAVVKAAGLDAAVRNIGTLGVENFEQFGDKAIEISKRVPASAKEIAEATYNAISAGVAPERAAEFVEQTTKAAIGGLTDSATAVDATTVLNAYKLSADQTTNVLDMMFAAVAAGKLTFEEMASSMGNVIPNASAAGVQFNEIAAASATMTMQGQSQSQAMTRLNQLIAEFLKPGADLEGLLKRAGYESGMAALQTDGLHGSLAKLGIVAESEGKVLSQYTSSTEAGAAALSLAGDNANFAAENLKKMNESAGMAGQAFELNAGSMENQLKQLNNQWDAILIKLGRNLMPIIRDVVDGLDGVLRAIDGIAANISAVFEGDIIDGLSNVGYAMTDGLFGAAKYLSGGLIDLTDVVQTNAEKTKEAGEETEKAAAKTNAAGKATETVTETNKKAARTITTLRGEIEQERAALEKLEVTDKKGIATKLARIGALEKELKQLTEVSTKVALVANSLAWHEERLSKLREKLRKTNVESANYDAIKAQLKQQEEDLKLLTDGAAKAFGNSVARLKAYIVERTESASSEVIPLVNMMGPEATKKMSTELSNAIARAKELYGESTDEYMQYVQKRTREIALEYEHGMGKKIGAIQNVDISIDPTFKEQAEKEKALVEEKAQLGQDLGIAFGEGFADALASGKPVLREAMRELLNSLLDYAYKNMLIAIFNNAVSNFATLGPLGLIKAAGETAVLTALYGTLKAGITGMETGGVLVGERGPEVIAPATEFSEFSANIVAAALSRMDRYASQMASARDSAGNMRLQLGSDPVTIRIRGRDLQGALRMQEKRARRNRLGDS